MTDDDGFALVRAISEARAAFKEIESAHLRDPESVDYEEYLRRKVVYQSLLKEDSARDRRDFWRSVPMGLVVAAAIIGFLILMGYAAGDVLGFLSDLFDG